jgi:hypothetical protein
VLREVRAELARSLPTDWSVVLTGQFAMGHDWVSELQDTQLRSFLGAFLIVLLLVAVHVRSFRWSLIAMLPTLLPVVILLGSMGLLGLSLDVGRSMIAALIIGIGVDDTVHLLSHFRDHRTGGATAPEAIRRAVLFVGRPVITSSLALSIGFLSLMTSSWQTVSSFGFFVGLGILGALLADLFVFPALVVVVAGRMPDWERNAGGTKKWVSRLRRGPPLALIFLPILLPLVVGIAFAVTPGPRALSACRVLPNGQIALQLLDQSHCPLRAFDQVRSIEREGLGLRLAVYRSAVEEWVEIPLRLTTRGERLATIASAAVLALAIVAIPSLLLRSAGSAAGPPLALFYASVAGILFCANCGVQSPWLDRLQLLAGGIAPAALGHLVLAFPGDRGVMHRLPGIQRIPYLVAFAFLPIAWIAMERHGILWAPVIYLLIALTLGLWIVLLASCAFALRESKVPIERARARLVLYGTLLLPMAPALLLGERTTEFPEIASRYLLVSAAFVPLPISLAVSRYDLFNLGLDALTLALHVARLWLGAHGSAPDPVPLFALGFAAAVLIDAVRWTCLGRLEELFAPSGERIRSAREDFARRIAELHEEDDVATLLGEALTRAIAPRNLCVFVSSKNGWRPVTAIGSDAPLDRAVAESAAALVHENRTLCLASLPRTETSPACHLAARGVAVVSPLRVRGKLLGLLVLGETQTRTGYTRVEERRACPRARWRRVPCQSRTHSARPGPRRRQGNRLDPTTRAATPAAPRRAHTGTAGYSHDSGSLQ